MWSKRLDLSRDECRRCLRCLELDGYGRIVSVLRAQGSLTDEKKKLLNDLAKMLHISNERHRAEVRRAVNDEKLTLIAEQLNGPNTFIDWTIEGRRTIPLLPRLKAHTAFTGLANSLSLVLAAANENKIPRTLQNQVKVCIKETNDDIGREVLKTDEKSLKQNLIFNNETTIKKRKRSSTGIRDEKKSKRDIDDGVSCLEINPKDSEGDQASVNIVNSQDLHNCEIPPAKIVVKSNQSGDLPIVSNPEAQNTAKCEDSKTFDACNDEFNGENSLNVDRKMVTSDEIDRKTQSLEDKVNKLNINNVDKTLKDSVNISTGPGPPSINFNHNSVFKMGMNINYHSNLNKNKYSDTLTSNPNVLLVQKGSTNSITLSHGGKEILGKVISDSKNLCLSNSSINLLSKQSIKNNIECKLKFNKPINTSNNTEVADKKQDNPRLIVNDHLTLNNIELKTANHSSQLLNRNSSSPLPSHYENHITNENRNTRAENLVVESEDSSIELECQEVLTSDQQVINSHLLDPQTQIYKFEATDDHICEIQIDETQESDVDLLTS